MRIPHLCGITDFYKDTNFFSHTLDKFCYCEWLTCGITVKNDKTQFFIKSKYLLIDFRVPQK